MGIDWGRAIAEGVEGGARAEQGVLVKDQDEQRWLDREKQLQAMEADQDKNRQLFMRGIEPPQIRTTHVNKTGDDGKTQVMDRQQQWVVDPATQKGAWQDFGEDVPNVNQERLEESARHNAETESLRGEANAARAGEAASRIDVARERLAAEDARHHGGEVQPKPYTFTQNGKPVIRYGTFDSSGTFVPAKDEHGQAIQGDKFRPSVFQEKRDAEAQGIKGTLSNLASAMGLGPVADVLNGYGPSSGGNGVATPSAPAPSSAAPAPAAGGAINGKRVVRTGTLNGRRVAKLEDGSTVDAATGQPIQ
jgi:hypothetical protein